jgi:hypothetical protein
VAAENSTNPTMERLEDQIAWYGKASRRNRLWYKWLKTVTVISALLIAPLSTNANSVPFAGGLGIAIAIAEGLQQLNQFQTNWLSYRATAEALKHEKYLYLAKAGLYGSVDNAITLLAERVEALVSQENSKWITYQEQSSGKPDSSAS